jgi:hypothetical protein
MAALHKSEFENPLLAWIDSRLPLMHKEYAAFPTPKNFNYFWNFGALATVVMAIMIATGVLLAMSYQPNVTLAFMAGWCAICTRTVQRCSSSLPISTSCEACITVPTRHRASYCGSWVLSSS